VLALRKRDVSIRRVDAGDFGRLGARENRLREGAGALR
jgi:hypothetical protein